MAKFHEHMQTNNWQW